MSDFGCEEGDVCNRDGCEGIIDEHYADGGCYCHCGNPPCSHCVDDRRYCEECGWEAIDCTGDYQYSFKLNKKYLLLGL